MHTVFSCCYHINTWLRGISKRFGMGSELLMFFDELHSYCIHKANVVNLWHMKKAQCCCPQPHFCCFWLCLLHVILLPSHLPTLSTNSINTARRPILNWHSGQNVLPLPVGQRAIFLYSSAVTSTGMISVFAQSSYVSDTTSQASFIGFEVDFAGVCAHVKFSCPHVVGF